MEGSTAVSSVHTTHKPQPHAYLVALGHVCQLGARSLLQSPDAFSLDAAVLFRDSLTGVVALHTAVLGFVTAITAVWKRCHQAE